MIPSIRYLSDKMMGWKTDWWLSGIREEMGGRVGREGDVVMKGQRERLM